MLLNGIVTATAKAKPVMTKAARSGEVVQAEVAPLKSALRPPTFHWNARMAHPNLAVYVIYEVIVAQSGLVPLH